MENPIVFERESVPQDDAGVDCFEEWMCEKQFIIEACSEAAERTKGPALVELLRLMNQVSNEKAAALGVAPEVVFFDD